MMHYQLLSHFQQRKTNKDKKEQNKTKGSINEIHLQCILQKYPSPEPHSHPINKFYKSSQFQCNLPHPNQWKFDENRNFEEEHCLEICISHWVCHEMPSNCISGTIPTYQKHIIFSIFPGPVVKSQKNVIPEML